MNTSTTVATKSPLPNSLEAEARLKIEQVSTLTGWGRAKIYNELRAGNFPEPERRGLRCTRWRAGDVLDWLDRSRTATDPTRRS